MKRYFTIAAVLMLAACQPNGAADIQDADVVDAETMSAANPTNISVPPDGKITLSAEPLISEDAACIVPLRISNGTENEVSVSMFGFAVTGSGTDDTGNMFPQDVPAGEYRTARIIQIGQSCSAFDTITTTDVLCKSGGADCSVIFEDSPEIKFEASAN